MAFANWCLDIERASSAHVSRQEWKIERNITYCQRSFEGNEILLDAINGFICDNGPTVFKHGSDVDWFPFDWYLRCGEDVFDGLRNFGTNTISFDQCDRELSLSVPACKFLGVKVRSYMAISTER